eukprot:scaffold742_cov395-Prasinococcus_capsulatus_cf.AAC.21
MGQKGSTSLPIGSSEGPSVGWEGLEMASHPPKTGILGYIKGAAAVSATPTAAGHRAGASGTSPLQTQMGYFTSPLRTHYMRTVSHGYSYHHLRSPHVSYPVPTHAKVQDQARASA